MLQVFSILYHFLKYFLRRGEVLNFCFARDLREIIQLMNSLQKSPIS